MGNTGDSNWLQLQKLMFKSFAPTAQATSIKLTAPSALYVRPTITPHVGLNLEVARLSVAKNLQT